MKKFALLSFVLFFIVGTLSFGQNNLGVVGKIISEEQANQLFGNAQKSFHITGKQLATFVASTHEYLLVGLKENGNALVVLDNHRKPIFPRGYKVGQNDEFFVFSISKINELLGTGSKKITVETRNDGVLTILAKDAVVSEDRGDGQVLEFSLPCPPLCPN